MHTNGSYLMLTHHPSLGFLFNAHPPPLYWGSYLMHTTPPFCIAGSVPPMSVVSKNNVAVTFYFAEVSSYIIICITLGVGLVNQTPPLFLELACPWCQHHHHFNHQHKSSASFKFPVPSCRPKGMQKTVLRPPKCCHLYSRHLEETANQASTPINFPIVIDLRREDNLSKMTGPICQVLLWAGFQVMRVKLQPPTTMEMNAYNPVLPPPSISQVLLLANPTKASLSPQSNPPLPPDNNISFLHSSNGNFE